MTAHSGIEVLIKYRAFSGYLENMSMYVFTYASIFRLVAEMASHTTLELFATLPDVF